MLFWLILYNTVGLTLRKQSHSVESTAFNTILNDDDDDLKVTDLPLIECHNMTLIYMDINEIIIYFLMKRRALCVPPSKKA